MTMQVYRSVGISTVRCEGNICFGGSAEALERTVQKFATGIVVIDMEKVVLVDARGLGALVALRQWTVERGVRLYLANPRVHVQELLRITGLTFLFDSEIALLASEIIPNDRRTSSRRETWSTGRQPRDIDAP